MTPLDVADWRRRVFALYEEVRATPDAAAAHARWRAGRDELFVHHAASALMEADRPGFTGLPVADYDPAWRFELTVEPADDGHFDFETGTDGIVPFERIGLVRIPGVGSLDVWRLTSYGGGRYLLDTIKGADLGSDPAANTLVVDFNFAYNPSCAYDPAWACPLAPATNTVPVEIPVGELYFGNY